jgi:hypothetical protein
MLNYYKIIKNKKKKQILIYRFRHKYLQLFKKNLILF